MGCIHLCCSGIEFPGDPGILYPDIYFAQGLKVAGAVAERGRLEEGNRGGSGQFSPATYS